MKMNKQDLIHEMHKINDGAFVSESSEDWDAYASTIEEIADLLMEGERSLAEDTASGRSNVCEALGHNAIVLP